MLELRAILVQVLAYSRQDSDPEEKLFTRHSVRDEKKMFAGYNVRILVVEDDFNNQNVTMGLLSQLGLPADAVNSGDEALRILENEIYDLILLDIRMPGADGYDVTSIIRDPESKIKKHDVPVIALTANVMSGARAECLDAGMDDYIAKPVSFGVLAEVLEKWLPNSD